MVTSLSQVTAVAPATRGPGACSLIAAWMRRIVRAEQARFELHNMTDVELKDIGLTRGQIGAVADGRYRR
jgi:uncharacterized protein YjiS (DUF1127 family)